MMSRSQLLSLLATLALGAFGTWLWYDNFEERMLARYHQSDAVRDNPMLAATLLLQQERHPVIIASTLSEVDFAKLADGMLLLAEPNGLLTERDAASLRAWVRRGNTLVTRPRWLAGGETAFGLKPTPTPPSPSHTPTPPNDGETAAAQAARVEFDPFAVRLGVRSTYAQAQATRCAPSAPAVPVLPPTAKEKAQDKPPQVLPQWRGLRLVCATLPDNGHVIELDTGSTILVSLQHAVQAEMSDDKAEAVRVYREGKGHLVMLASNYFNNDRLQHFDHAELLLFLTRLNPAKASVTIVQRLDVLPWYRALWKRYALALGSAALGLLLLLWAATRRFGPLLPDATPERRALIEHIDASGAWLWKLPGGRRLLLDAVRAGVVALLERRVLGLRHLGPADQCALLARATRLPVAALDFALFEPPAPLPRDFTRQIRTLMQLRNHYER